MPADRRSRRPARTVDTPHNFGPIVRGTVAWIKHCDLVNRAASNDGTPICSQPSLGPPSLAHVPAAVPRLHGARQLRARRTRAAHRCPASSPRAHPRTTARRPAELPRPPLQALPDRLHREDRAHDRRDALRAARLSAVSVSHLAAGDRRRRGRRGALDLDLQLAPRAQTARPARPRFLRRPRRPPRLQPARTTEGATPPGPTRFWPSASSASRSSCRSSKNSSSAAS